jgi:hypothetical protein
VQSTIEMFLADKAPRTREAYRRDLQQFADYLERLSVQPRDVRRYHLIAYRDHLDQEGYAATTVTRRLTVARLFVNDSGGSIRSGVRSAQMPAPAHTVGLAEVASMIRAVSSPALVPEGVATLLSVSRIATVDELLRLTPTDLDGTPALTVGPDRHELPGSIRPTLRALVEQAGRGLLFGGITRQTLTRRVRGLGEAVGVDGCTPRVLARSSDRVTLEAVASVSDSDGVPRSPGDRLAVIAEAIRSATFA